MDVLAKLIRELEAARRRGDKAKVAELELRIARLRQVVQRAIDGNLGAYGDAQVDSD